MYLCSKDLHVVFDEVYALTVFDDDTTFTSVLALTDIPCPEKTHHIWAFSKVNLIDQWIYAGSCLSDSFTY